jgi:WD40 repeat protein
MVLTPSNARLLTEPADRVLGVAWSPNGRTLAAVSEDNYVRAWDAQSWRCTAVSEDYPYPRAIYFADEKTVVVIDVALRRYTFSPVACWQWPSSPARRTRRWTSNFARPSRGAMPPRRGRCSIAARMPIAAMATGEQR